MAMDVPRRRNPIIMFHHNASYKHNLFRSRLVCSFHYETLCSSMITCCTAFMFICVSSYNLHILQNFKAHRQSSKYYFIHKETCTNQAPHTVTQWTTAGQIRRVESCIIFLFDLTLRLGAISFPLVHNDWAFFWPPWWLQSRRTSTASKFLKATRTHFCAMPPPLSSARHAHWGGFLLFFPSCRCKSYTTACPIAWLILPKIGFEHRQDGTFSSPAARASRHDFWYILPVAARGNSFSKE